MPGFGDSVPVLIALMAGLFAPLSGWAARFRSRSAAVWFVLGAFSGPVALLILAASPPARCPDCDRPVAGWDRSCARCGATFPPFWAEVEVASPPRPVSEPAPAIEPISEPAPAIEPIREPAPAIEPIREPAPAATPVPATAQRNGRDRAAIPPAARPTSPPEGAPAAAVMPVAPAPPATSAAHASDAVATSPTATQWPAAPAPAGHSPEAGSTAAAVEATPPAIPPVEAAPPPPAPPAAPATSMPPEAAAEMRVLATGIYVLGNGGLEVGARYALALAGDHLRIFGPVDLGEVTVRHDRPIARLEVTAVGDQLIISSTRSGNLSMVFQRLGGMSPAELERRLTPAVSGGGSSGVLRT